MTSIPVKTSAPEEPYLLGFRTHRRGSKDPGDGVFTCRQEIYQLQCRGRRGRNTEVFANGSLLLFQKGTLACSILSHFEHEVGLFDAPDPSLDQRPWPKMTIKAAPATMITDPMRRSRMLVSAK